MTSAAEGGGLEMLTGEGGGGGKISQNVTDVILCALCWDRQ